MGDKIENFLLFDVESPVSLISDITVSNSTQLNININLFLQYHVFL